MMCYCRIDGMLSTPMQRLHFRSSFCGRQLCEQTFVSWGLVGGGGALCAAPLKRLDKAILEIECIHVLTAKDR